MRRTAVHRWRESLRDSRHADEGLPSPLRLVAITRAVSWRSDRARWIGDSSQDHLQNLTFWKYNNPVGSLSSAPLPSTVLNQSAPAAPTRAASPAICNRPQWLGLLNSEGEIGDIATLKKFDQFAPFTVENVTVAARHPA